MLSEQTGIGIADTNLRDARTPAFAQECTPLHELFFCLLTLPGDKPNDGFRRERCRRGMGSMRGTFDYSIPAQPVVEAR